MTALATCRNPACPGHDTSRICRGWEYEPPTRPQLAEDHAAREQPPEPGCTCGSAILCPVHRPLAYHPEPRYPEAPERCVICGKPCPDLDDQEPGQAVHAACEDATSVAPGADMVEDEPPLTGWTVELPREQFTVRSFIAQVKALADRLPEGVRSVTLGLHGCDESVLAELEEIGGAERDVLSYETEEWDSVSDQGWERRLRWSAYGHHRPKGESD